MVELQRGFVQFLEFLTSPALAASADANASYFQVLVQASQQYWDKVSSVSEEDCLWLEAVAEGMPATHPAPPPPSAPPLPAEALRLRVKAPPSNLRGTPPVCTPDPAAGRAAGPAPPPQPAAAASVAAEFVQLGTHRQKDGLIYTVTGTPVDRSKGIVFFLTTAGKIGRASCRERV